jgi:hypothetical protein
VPPNPKAGFDGIVVRCQVLECEPPSRLAYSWSAGPIIDTQVIYRLEPDGDGTRVFFEHSGFDLSQPWGEPALRGAEFGWEKMLERFVGVVASPGIRPRQRLRTHPFRARRLLDVHDRAVGLADYLYMQS